jgi:hypothetical protein
MDEAAYRSARGEINRLPCVFEKALSCRGAVCQLAAAHALAERESVACTSPLARADCGELAGLLREKSAFALRLAGTESVLPHGQMLRIQCGGLLGLQSVLDPDAPAPEVRRLVLAARMRYGHLAALPFSEIVKGVAAYRLRRRRKA